MKKFAVVLIDENGDLLEATCGFDSYELAMDFLNDVSGSEPCGYLSVIEM